MSINPHRLTKQIKKDPLQARKLIIQEVINRLSEYEGFYLAELMKLNDQYPIDQPVEYLGQRLSSQYGIISEYETSES